MISSAILGTVHRMTNYILLIASISLSSRMHHPKVTQVYPLKLCHHRMALHHLRLPGHSSRGRCRT